MSFMAPSLDQEPRSRRLRALIDDLILFGKVLIETLTLEPASEVAARLIKQFGTENIAAIIARITRGIMLATALDERVARCAKQIDGPPRIRPDNGVKRAERQRSAKRPAAADGASLLIRMPTAVEIAASIRKRTIGAVLADIAHDLGLTEYDPLFMRIFGALQGAPCSRSVIRLLQPRIDATYPPRRRRTPPPAATLFPLPNAATGPPTLAAA